MAEARRWVPLLLCLLQSSPGKPRLAPPQNVTLLSQNFSVYLTWLPGPGNPQNVTYFVAYQSLPNPLRWRRVKRCAGSKELACSLTCLEKQDLFNKFKGRVQAVSPSSRSPWVESEYMDYLSEVEPAPPILIITRREEGLRVNATYQLPRCVPLPNLKYEVHFWREETGNKTLFPATPHGQPIQIPLQPAASGRHCLSARTIYTFIYSKYSKFSSPTCFFLEAPGATWPFSVLPSLLLPLLLVVAIGGIIWKSNLGSPWFQQAKMPRALDFSGHRHPVATFKPSGLESPDDLFLCPQKELTRRVRLSPRVRAPATLPAGSEDSAEDEEEDTDDSGSFEPYIGPPPFLGPERQILGHSGADRPDSGGLEDEEEDTDDSGSFEPYIGPSPFLGPERQILGHSGADRPDSGGLWLPLVQVEDCPAWDASDSSWATTVDSSPWGEAKTPGYVAKKGTGKEVEGDRHWEPLPLPKFPEDSGSLEESPKDDLSSWATWGSTAKGPNLVPGDPPVSLQTLVFCWESSPNEEEEEEEGGGGSETEASGAGGGRPGSPQDTEGRDGLLGHYMAR